MTTSRRGRLRRFARNQYPWFLIGLALLAIAGTTFGVFATDRGLSFPISGPVSCSVLPEPQFPDREPDEVTLRDGTGLVTDCRQVDGEAAFAIWNTYQPALDSFDFGRLYLSQANRARTRLLTMWVTYGCDRDARIELRTSNGGGLTLGVNQERVPPCPPGTAMSAFEITMSRSFAEDGLSGAVQRIEVSGP